MAKKKSENDGNHSEDSEGGCEEPNFDDPEDFVDAIADEDLLADLISQKPRETDGVESVVVVDNIPVVAPQRLEKLKAVIERIFSNVGEIVNVYHPVDEESNTKGFAFIEFNNPASAEEAVKKYNQHRLDRVYTFSVNLFTDFQKYEHIPENWEPPTAQPYKIQKDLYTFISEPDAYDQFSVAVESGSNSVQVQFWQNTLPEPTNLETRERFTDNFAKWSPKGTYIVTLHKQGVALWGGEKFTRINKFLQNDPHFVDFSPNEQYLVTYAPTSTGQKIIIWDIRTGQEKRSFESDGMNKISMCRWSHDDQFFARMVDNSIHVYETTTFFLLDLKSIKVPGIKNFSWSPTDNVIAYWVAEEIDVPAMVRIIEIPKKRQIRSKNLFNVSDCIIHWQKSGDYLCVKVDRFTKSRKDKKDADVKFLGMYYNFEIFHMREKDIPVDSVEIKESILAFAWEPVGSKFAIIHGEPSITSVSFYEVKIGQTPVLLKKLEKKMCTHLFWSPRGQFIVLANLSMGTFEFVDTENDFVIMNSGDHYRASDVQWDPTGRYCVTGVSAWNVKEDTGYNIWSFQGKVLRRILLTDFIQFLWRPRPATLLTEEHQLKIKKGLKKYYPQFEHKDRIRMSRASKELLEKRAQLRNQFNEYRSKKILQWNEQKEKRLELRDNIDTDNMFGDDVEEEIEFLIKEDKNIIE